VLEVLRNIVQEVNAAESLDEVLSIIVSRVRMAMGTEVCSVYIRDREASATCFAPPRA
jgi:phosphotransferase system enzyme I (PtsP)